MIKLTYENLESIVEGRNKILSFVDDVWGPLREIGENAKFKKDGTLSKRDNEAVNAIINEHAPGRVSDAFHYSHNDDINLHVGLHVFVKVPDAYMGGESVYNQSFYTKIDRCVYSAAYPIVKPDTTPISARDIDSLIRQYEEAREALSDLKSIVYRIESTLASLGLDMKRGIEVI